MFEFTIHLSGQYLAAALDARCVCIYPSSFNRPFKDGRVKSVSELCLIAKIHGHNRFLGSIPSSSLGLQTCFWRAPYFNGRLRYEGYITHIWNPRLRLDIEPRNRLRPIFLWSDEALRHFWHALSFKGRLRDEKGEVGINKSHFRVPRLINDPWWAF